MNAKENRMRIAREARRESESSPGSRRKDEREPNRMLVNSDEIRFIEKMRQGGKECPPLSRQLNGKPFLR